MAFAILIGYLLFNVQPDEPTNIPLQHKQQSSVPQIASNVFIFGYGSLINSKSREETGITGEAVPVRVHRMKRGWIYDVDTLHHPTISNTPFTAVGVQLDSAHYDYTVNGVIFPLELEEIPKYDAREARYQRVQIALEDIELVGNGGSDGDLSFLTDDAIVYVYMVPDDIALSVDATENRRVLKQSYIDKFISGCFEVDGIEFATECVQTTDGWNGLYENDRKQSDFSMSEISSSVLREIDDLLDALEPQLKS